MLDLGLLEGAESGKMASADMTILDRIKSSHLEMDKVSYNEN